VKLSLVGLALAWGGVHQLLVLPRLERGAGGGSAVLRSLRAESAVAMAVLLVAAVLVDSKPPERQPPQAPTAAQRR
jgi:putative copper export protein